MAISIYTLKQDIIEVKGQLDDGNLEEAKDLFSKLEDDVKEVFDFLDECLAIQK